MTPRRKDKDEEKAKSEAKDYVRNLIKHRPRTEKEVLDRLEGKDFSPSVIEDILEWAKEGDLVNDRAFARVLIQDRLQNKPTGRSGLYKQLLDHGVDKPLANEVLDEQFQDVDEENLCRELAEKRFNRYSGDDKKAKYRKTTGFLLRRGFPKGMVHKIVRGLVFNDES